MQPCPLVFEGRDAAAVERGWRAKSDCDDADKAALRAERDRLIERARQP